MQTNSPAFSILLVEDEAPLRTVVSQVLVRFGYEVLLADSGKAALEIWSQHSARIDLLFTDLVMPEGINGLELAHQLRAEKPSLRVIFTTGYDPEVIAPAEELRKGNNFLLKPYRPNELLQIVASVLGAARTSSDLS